RYWVPSIWKRNLRSKCSCSPSRNRNRATVFTSSSLPAQMAPSSTRHAFFVSPFQPSSDLPSKRDLASFSLNSSAAIVTCEQINKAEQARKDATRRVMANHPRDQRTSRLTKRKAPLLTWGVGGNL